MFANPSLSPLALSPLALSPLALRGALSAALLIGVAQHTALAHEYVAPTDAARGKVEAELRKGNTARAVELGEAAVADAPQDAVLRAELGHAYLRVGRFEAASAALTDALALGDTTDRIALSLALAQIACGQNRAALATLDHGEGIAAADLGLALALAGDPARGVGVLTDAVRNGPGTANLRQNLAYAYALDGRWADATLTAGFDLPPDQVSTRLQQWAETMQAGAERVRIARLLSVPLIADAGMPAALALNTVPAEPVPAPVQAALVAELPALPVAAVAAMPAPVVAAAVPAPPAMAMMFVAVPVVQAVTTAPPPVAYHHMAVQAHGAQPASAHFVQLAAYHNRHDAERGKAILARRHPLLRGHGLLIAEDRRGGRGHWQVVMAGFDGATAANMCANLKRSGLACFAYSARPKGASPALAAR